jgi:hypothetical protein
MTHLIGGGNTVVLRYNSPPPCEEGLGVGLALEAMSRRRREGIAEHSQNKYRCFGFVLILSQV